MTIRFRRRVRRRTDKSRRGTNNEQLALDFLIAAGLELVQRNYHCRLGELDLVMREGDCIAIVEVRSRRHGRFLQPQVTVDRPKQRRIERAAAMFLANRTDLGEAPVRFDVVAIEEASRGPGKIQWIKDAFRP